mmetsp:Transcript_24701/g.97994  ORF Transcript_24701/g.97994 Transcript_24701/m.97994 type:complete len:281 (-) Transcript_24701:237-1079(-)
MVQLGVFLIVFRGTVPRQSQGFTTVLCTPFYHFTPLPPRPTVSHCYERDDDGPSLTRAGMVEAAAAGDALIEFGIAGLRTRRWSSKIRCQKSILLVNTVFLQLHRRPRRPRSCPRSRPSPPSTILFKLAAPPLEEDEYCWYSGHVQKRLNEDGQCLNPGCTFTVRFKKETMSVFPPRYNKGPGKKNVYARIQLPVTKENRGSTWCLLESPSQPIELELGAEAVHFVLENRVLLGPRGVCRLRGLNLILVTRFHCTFQVMAVNAISRVHPGTSAAFSLPGF